MSILNKTIKKLVNKFILKLIIFFELDILFLRSVQIGDLTNYNECQRGPVSILQININWRLEFSILGINANSNIQKWARGFHKNVGLMRIMLNDIQ